MSDYTYFVSGRVYARLFGSTDQFEWPGLVDTISLAVTQNTIQLPDRTKSGGGIYKEVRRIESVAMTMNHRELYPSTLARALYGSQSLIASAAIADESHIIKLGQFVPLAHPGVYTALSVTDNVAAVIDSENYEVRPGGLFIPANAPDIVDDDEILVSYTHPAYNRVEALTGSPPELELFFEGTNEANNDTPSNVRLHKVRFGAAETLELLSGDDFGSLSLTGEVLADTTKGAGLSQFFFIDQPVPA